MIVIHLELPRRSSAPGCSSCGGLVISDGPFRTGTDRCCLRHWARLCADCLRRTHPQEVRRLGSPQDESRPVRQPDGSLGPCLSCPQEGSLR